jgi:hypothetical protein
MAFPMTKREKPWERGWKNRRIFWVIGKEIIFWGVETLVLAGIGGLF